MTASGPVGGAPDEAFRSLEGSSHATAQPMRRRTVEAERHGKAGAGSL